MKKKYPETNIEPHFTIRPVAFSHPEIHELVVKLDQEMAQLYPPESIVILTPSEMEDSNGIIFAAEIDQQLCGCGALVPNDSFAEIKRMYVLPAFRQKGIAKKILQALQVEALKRGLTTVRLETGELLVGAMALYEAEGFKRIENYGIYKDLPLSICFEKKLSS